MTQASPAPTITSVSIDLSHEAATTVDVITLTVKALINGGQPAALDGQTQASLEASGWTVLRVSPEPPRIDPATGDIAHVWSINVEPFLEGRYTVPPITVRVGDAQASTDASAIEIASVITSDQDTEALTASLGTPPEPMATPTDSAVTPLVIVAITVGMTFAAAFFLRRQSVKPTAVTDPTEALRSPAPSDQQLATALRALAGRRIRILGAPLAATTDELRRAIGPDAPAALRDLLNDLERLDAARFGDAPLTDDDRQAIADRARHLLSGSPQGAAL